MNNKRRLLGLGLGLLSLAHSNSISVSGQNDLRALIDSLDTQNPSKHLDNWLDLNISNSKLSLDLGFEIHTPPFPGSFSPQDTIGIQYRNFQFQNKELTLQVGHFFNTLGNGITLKSYEDREMGWNTNIDGVHFAHSSSLLEGSFFGGKMRDTFGKRYDLIQGGFFKLHPIPQFNPGLTTVFTKLNNEASHWGSLTSDFYFPWLDFKIEFATFDFINSPQDWKERSATYLNSNLYIDSYAIFMEAKYYKNFALSQNNLEYNAPPPVTQVHFFSLFQDQNPVDFRGNNEKGFLVEAKGELLADLFTKLSYSQTQSISQSQVLFEELYSQFEYPIKKLSTLSGLGYQKDFNGHSIHGGTHLSLPINKHSLSLTWAHQHKTISRSFLVPREYFLQSYELSYSWSNFSSSIISTLSSEPQQDKPNDFISQYWLGGQLDFKIGESHSVSLFGGTRKEGKICAGGVCVKKPELVGGELNIKSNF